MKNQNFRAVQGLVNMPCIVRALLQHYLCSDSAKADPTSFEAVETLHEVIWEWDWIPLPFISVQNTVYCILRKAAFSAGTLSYKEAGAARENQIFYREFDPDGGNFCSEHDWSTSDGFWSQTHAGNNNERLYMSAKKKKTLFFIFLGQR